MNISSVAIGQYIPGESLVHRLDPRTKIMLSLVVVIALFIAKSAWAYAALAALIVGTVMASRVPVKMVLRGLRPL
ncbi:MAG: energy-coupling factor transporter transmembrane protein EcfT, partial [Firmicutes bacterium]|nr:energy-coupling factor transporter transmembrane protein EcfT [Bacillota bacterium]